ncbi:MAG: extracellular solute-binding protein [Clostridia bacterium]|nr:extracellular solute-binding protein [Clostridia bacterium]
MKKMLRWTALLLVLCLLPACAMAEEASGVVIQGLAAAGGTVYVLDGGQVHEWHAGTGMSGTPLASGVTLIAGTEDMLYAMSGKTLCRISGSEMESVITVEDMKGTLPGDLAIIGDAAYILNFEDTDNLLRTRTLYEVNMKSGQVRMVRQMPLLEIEAAGEMLLGLTPEDEGAALAIIDPQRLQIASTIPLEEDRPGGLAWDGSCAYIAGDTRLKRVDLSSGRVEVADWLSLDSHGRQRDVSALPALVSGGAYLYADSEKGIVSASTDPSAKAERPLRIAMYDTPAELQGFTRAHPDIPVEIISSAASMEVSELTQQMLTGDDQSADIYMVSMNSLYKALRDKGYCIDLSQSEIIAKTIGSFYPNMTSQLYREDGALVAFPADINICDWGYYPAALEELGMTEEDLPSNYMELMDMIASWPEDAEIHLFDGAVNRFILFVKIRYDQRGRCAAAGIPLTFDTPAFRQLLQRLDEISPILEERFAKAPAVSRSAGGVTNALLTTNALWLPGDRFMSDKPLLLSNVEGERPCTVLQMNVYIINPYSPLKEEAMTFLEYAAENMDQTMRTAFDPNCNDPVEDPEYARNCARMRKQIAQLEMMLSEAESEASRRNIQDSIEFMQEGIEMAETWRWRVKPEAIAEFREIAPYVAVEVADFSNDNLQTLTDRYTDGQIAAEQFIREAERMLQMAAWE